MSLTTLLQGRAELSLWSPSTKVKDCCYLLTKTDIPHLHSWFLVIFLWRSVILQHILGILLLLNDLLVVLCKKSSSSKPLPRIWCGIDTFDRKAAIYEVPSTTTSSSRRRVFRSTGSVCERPLPDDAQTTSQEIFKWPALRWRRFVRLPLLANSLSVTWRMLWSLVTMNCDSFW